METGFPLVMLFGPLVAAAIALVARGWRRVATAVGLLGLAILTLLLLLAAPGTGLFSDNVAGFYSQEVVLTPLTRSLFLFLYPALSLLFTLHWFRPLGRAFVPAALAALSPLAGALMIGHLGLGAVLVVIAAAALVPALYGGHYEPAGAAWRYFLLIAAALAPMLIVASPLLGGAASLPWLASLLAALILFGGFPFHVWAGGLLRRSPLAATALALGLAQIVVAVFVLMLLDTAPGARASVEFQTAVRWSAALTALVAAFLMARAANWRELIAAATLLDMGFLATAALVPAADGLLIALPALVARYLSLALVTLALGWMPPGETSRAARSFRWAARLPSILLPYAVLSLIGLPLTPGFSGRWGQLLVIGRDAGALPSLLSVTAIAAAAYIAIRTGRRLAAEPSDSATTVSRGEWVIAALLFGLIALAALFPDLLTAFFITTSGLN